MNEFDEKIAEFDAKPKLIKYRTIIAAEEAHKEDKKLQSIYNEFSNDPKRYVLELTNIADAYQIAKVKHKRKGQPSEILYHVYVNFKRLNICTYSFDSALIEAISHRHNCEHAALWIGRMIGLKDEPQFEDE